MLCWAGACWAPLPAAVARLRVNQALPLTQWQPRRLSSCTIFTPWSLGSLCCSTRDLCHLLRGSTMINMLCHSPEWRCRVISPCNGVSNWDSNTRDIFSSSLKLDSLVLPAQEVRQVGHAGPSQLYPLYIQKADAGFPSKEDILYSAKVRKTLILWREW